VGAAVSVGLVASTVMLYSSKFCIYIYKCNFDLYELRLPCTLMELSDERGFDADNVAAE
jgi:hypothetical protein